MICPICLTLADFELIKPDRSCQVLRCKSCKSIFPEIYINTIVSNNSILFPKKYPLKITLLPNFIINRYVSQIVSKFDLDYVSTYANLKNIKTSLDVGAKFGFIVKYLLKCGIFATGLEPQFYPLSLQQNMIRGILDESYDFASKKYDLITMGDVLYLIPNSLEILKKIISMLNTGGYLMITSYNPECTNVIDIINRQKSINNIFISKKGYEKICSENECELVSFNAYDPVLYVIKINLVNKLRVLVSLFKQLFGIGNVFKRNDAGIKSYVMIRKTEFNDKSRKCSLVSERQNLRDE